MPARGGRAMEDFGGAVPPSEGREHLAFHERPMFFTWLAKGDLFPHRRRIAGPQRETSRARPHSDAPQSSTGRGCSGFLVDHSRSVFSCIAASGDAFLVTTADTSSSHPGVAPLSTPARRQPHPDFPPAVVALVAAGGSRRWQHRHRRLARPGPALFPPSCRAPCRSLRRRQLHTHRCRAPRLQRWRRSRSARSPVPPLVAARGPPVLPPVPPMAAPLPDPCQVLGCRLERTNILAVARTRYSRASSRPCIFVTAGRGRSECGANRGAASRQREVVLDGVVNLGQRLSPSR